MVNQEATGVGKAFFYGAGKEGGSHLADQEASGTGKAFVYGTGAGGRSNLAKLRDGARHCTELYAALRDGMQHCNSALILLFLLRILSGAGKAPWRLLQREFAAKNRETVHCYTVAYRIVAPHKALCSVKVILSYFY